jgi:hypothetical protein
VSSGGSLLAYARTSWFFASRISIRTSFAGAER